MGNNTSRSTQWSEAPAKPSYKMCLHRQWEWPFKSCTRPQGHEGEHCEERLAGTVMVSTWWGRELVRKPSP